MEEQLNNSASAVVNPVDASQLFWVRYGRAAFRNAFVNRTRTNQKTININGRIPSSRSRCVLVSKAGNSCGRARKMDAVATNNPKHMRERWRAIAAHRQDRPTGGCGLRSRSD